MTYSLLTINGTWTCMYTGDPEEAREHAKKIGAKIIRFYIDGRYVGEVV